MKEIMRVSFSVFELLLEMLGGGLFDFLKQGDCAQHNIHYLHFTNRGLRQRHGVTKLPTKTSLLT